MSPSDLVRRERATIGAKLDDLNARVSAAQADLTAITAQRDAAQELADEYDTFLATAEKAQPMKVTR